MLTNSYLPDKNLLSLNGWSVLNLSPSIVLVNGIYDVELVQSTTLCNGKRARGENNRSYK